MQNLITNSIDAFNHPHSGETIKERKIKITAIEEGKYINFVYEDNAGGIPEAVQKHMFDSFFTTKEVGKGTGLGLSMIKSIVKEHNGELSVVSSLGEGTKFMIRFPQHLEELVKDAS
jgi:signal transduction histidine kinase